jgi:transposase
MGRRSFAREFKVESAQLVKERWVSVTQAARDLGICQGVLGRWMRKAIANKTHAFPGREQMKPDDAELARLECELAKTKVERDIVKNHRLLCEGADVRFAAIARLRGIGPFENVTSITHSEKYYRTQTLGFATIARNGDRRGRNVEPNRRTGQSPHH